MTLRIDQPSCEESDRFAGDSRVINFGCRLNAYEADIIRDNLRVLKADYGIQNCIVVNSCAVTCEAEKQVRQAIRRLRRSHPQHKIIVTGCGAHVSRDTYAAMREVDAIIGNDVKTDRRAYDFLRLGQAETGVQVSRGGAIMECNSTSTQIYGKAVSKPQNRVRAFLEIQNGCDHRCTFCVIPYGRGASRSLAPNQVLSQVGHLIAQGVKEITLCGVDLTAYGGDLAASIGLGDLVVRICKSYPELPRLRLSSLDCIELDTRLIAAFGDCPQLQPHIHLSLQSGNDLILKRMKRRHSRADAIRLCRELRSVRPDILFGADFITGFPTEDEAMFADTLGLVEECDITWLHVFPYSPRQGTPAARIASAVLPSECRRRAKQLQELGQTRQKKYMQSLVGTWAMVLAEKHAYGYTENYAQVRLPATMGIGELRSVYISAVQLESPYALIAEI